jgi:hypothetical protein
VVVPRNPEIQFTPPPAFSAPASSASGATNRSAAVDCEVR